MRKSALLLTILLAASFSTAADAAKRKKMMTAPKPPVPYTNAQSGALVSDGLMNLLTFGQGSMAAPAPAKKTAMRTTKKKKKM